MSAAPELVSPAYLWVPEHSSTVGDEAADLAAACGIDLDPEQRLALDALLAERNGRWAAFEAALIAPRQNIKTHLFKIIALTDVTLLDTDLVMWSAHEFSTAMESMRDLLEIIEANDFLDRRVHKVNQANGEEGIEFVGGYRIRFKARTKTGARGLTAPRLLLDEAFALQPAHIGSLMPTMSALSVTGNPQIVYGSSAGRLSSSVLRSLRDRGRAGGDPSLIYVEWCDDGERTCEQHDCTHTFGSENCVLDDEERWQRANIALHRRISVDFVRMERRSMPPDEFAFERLGWWEDPIDGADGMLPFEKWGECANPSAELSDPLTFAIDVAPGFTSASIVACGGPLEVIEHRRGTGWVVERLKELQAEHHPAAVGLDPAGPAGALIPDFEREGVEVTLLDGKESLQACGGFLSAVLNGEMEHRDQPILNEAVAGAGRRQVGDAWKWSRRDSAVDISPLVAATVARYLWSTVGGEGVLVW